MLRPGLCGFPEGLCRLPGLRELVLTTNGLLLQEMAVELRRAGVQRVNVSLDSLHSQTFSAITGGGQLERVLSGIAAAESAGFPPVKINMVVMRHINDQEISDFAALTLNSPRIVRFIGCMPASGVANWSEAHVSGPDILSRVTSRYAEEKVEGPVRAGPARLYRIAGAQGFVGIIDPEERHFCRGYNRIRRF